MGFVHTAAEVDPAAQVDPSAFIWGLAQVRAGASVGAESVIGRGAYVGTGVTVGARVKVQNYALIYEPACLEDGVFVGPGAILTNDHHPRAILPNGRLKSADDWQADGVHVCKGASIGAGAICVAPLHVGAWALVGAGAIVSQDIPAYSLVVGNPARRVGWVGRAGRRLTRREPGLLWDCPVTGEQYEETNNVLTLVEGRL